MVTASAVSGLIPVPRRVLTPTHERNYLSRAEKKRSGIPIVPSGTESVAGRDDAKRPPTSPVRWGCCGCRERFPRKDPGVFDLLGSSLSCEATGLTPPNKHLCLRDTELCIPGHKRREGPHQGSAVAPRSGLVFFHPWVWSDFHICSAASFRRYRRSFSNGGPSGISALTISLLLWTLSACL